MEEKHEPKVVAIPISALVEPEGFGERDFFAEADNEQANDELEEAVVSKDIKGV